MRDRRIVFVLAFLRATSTSALGVTLGAYLAALEIDHDTVGIIISAGLSGAVIAAALATFAGDRLGRRAFLVGCAACAAVGTAGFAFAREPVALVVAACVGMVNGMGRDRGGAQIIELAILPSTTTDATRTRSIAVYTMLQDIGHAVGALLAGLPSVLAERTAWTPLDGHIAIVFGCAAAALAAAALSAMLGSTVEIERAPRLGLSRESRSILVKISALFGLDSLGGGFVTTALVSYFFFERFGASELAVAVLFASARIMNALSHLGAAWLARRIGLVNTMVFTHMPSSLLLVTVAFAPSFGVAAVLFLLREGLVEMDVPTRQSYVLAVVQPNERTFASGITNLVRLAGWAIAPLLAGLLMSEGELYLPLVVGAILKITYDLLLWRAFRALKPPEEQHAP
ncbi:MAG: MFS transporter [Myxococcota bacterium]|nr:MFS transporter [Myxococcota bacterium]